MLIDGLPDGECAIKLLRSIAAREPYKAARRVDKPLAIYGAGKLGRMAIELLDRLGIAAFAVVDREAERLRDDSFWHGRNVVSPEEFSVSIRSESLLAVSIATVPFHQLALELTVQGWGDIVPFYDIAQAYTDKYPLGNGWELDTFGEEEVVATSEVLKRWGDDISRAHHLQFIAWHRLREDWIFSSAQISQGDRYFIPQVLQALDEDSALLDIGAHHGETSQRFIDEVGENFRYVWMLEPDPVNADVIKHWLGELDAATRMRVSLLQCAASDHRGVEPFFGSIGYASQLSALGKSWVPVSTVDELRPSPTFMKLHIEGAELAALKGSIETLCRHRPIVAMTIYHNRLGVWEAPQWAMHFLAKEGYRFLLRLHSWCGTGLVFYAIQK